MYNFLSGIGACLISLLLSGCLGSEIVGRHPEKQAEFPSLATVPDRPSKEDENTTEKEPARSNESLQDARKFNQELRQYFGVPETVEKQQKTIERKTF